MLYTSHMTYNVTQDRLLHILQWKGEERHRLDIRWYLISQLTQTVMFRMKVGRDSGKYFTEARSTFILNNPQWICRTKMI